MKKINDPFSPENLTLTLEQMEAWRNGAHLDIPCELTEESRGALERYCRKRERLFVKAPLLESLDIAEKCHLPVMAVWLTFLYASFLHRGQNPVRLTNTNLRFNRTSKANALRQLEAIGKIQVKREPGKSPLIRIMSFPLHT